MVFNMLLTAPFRLIASKTSTEASKRPLHASRIVLKGKGKRSGGPFVLHPRETLESTLRFHPPSLADDGTLRAPIAKSALDVGAASASLDDPDDEKKKLRLKICTHGTLHISFANGCSQEIKLRTDIFRPMVVVGPSDYSFGAVHTESVSTVKLFVTNPTKVSPLLLLALSSEGPSCIVSFMFPSFLLILLFPCSHAYMHSPSVCFIEGRCNLAHPTYSVHAA